LLKNLVKWERGGGMQQGKERVNQLVIATVSSSQAGMLTNRLTRDGFYVTEIASSGGDYRRDNTLAADRT